MSEGDDDPAVPQGGDADLPLPRVERRRRWHVSLVWLLPAVAIVVAASLVVRTVFLVGPRVEVEFQSADGIEAGKTEVRYKEVVIGKVSDVTLRDDHKRVVVGLQLNRSASGFAVADTTFWVVRPRIGATGVSGLGTLLSGAYVATDAGVSSDSKKEFIGLETPPLVLRGEPGSVYVLHAEDLGSLDVGSPVFHKRTRVGRVVGYELDAARDSLSVKIFVEAAYTALVRQGTRFWNASGIDLTVNASGLTLNTQTIASILAGGIAFETPGGAAKSPPAAANAAYRLYGDQRTALAPPDGPPFPIRMVFDSSVRGLSEGAAIDVLGVELGNVTSIALQYDDQKKRFPIEVRGVIYPLRFRSLYEAVQRSPSVHGGGPAVVAALLVQNGMRAQLRTGNLLTGQLYVALDFIGKDRAAVKVDGDGTLEMPTARSAFSELQPQIAEIVEKVSKIPFDEIGRDLRSTLRAASTAINQLTPEAQRAMADVQKTLKSAERALDDLDRNLADPEAPVQKNLGETLQELQRASRSLRVLSDYLQQHPESLLRGKPADPTPPPR